MRLDPAPLDVLKLDVRVALDLIPTNEDGIEGDGTFLPTAVGFKQAFNLDTAILLDIIVAILIAAKRQLQARRKLSSDKQMQKLQLFSQQLLY